jgi:hypothetical protein
LSSRIRQRVAQRNLKVFNTAVFLVVVIVVVVVVVVFAAAAVSFSP